MSDTSTLLQKIDQLDGLTTDEKAQLKKLLNTQKEYGLVWEDKPEEVERQLLVNLPVLVEVKERYIAASKPDPVEKTPNKKGISEAQLSLGLETAAENPENQINPENPDSDNGPAPHHILIEGDNLHALTALSFTHKEKIDVIYIDPPYNTGNKDFKYNDSFVDKEDSYRHSKWLSFMHKRLVLAKQLLKETGVIFISIDDNEQAQLKLLCDSVFGGENFIANIIWQSKKGGGSDNNFLVIEHEYVSVFAKSKVQTSLNKIELEGEVLDKEDDKGKYRVGRELNKWGANSRRIDRPTMWFPIPGPNGEDVFPIRNDGSEGCWRWGKPKLLKAALEHDIEFIARENGTYIAFEKIRHTEPRKKPYRTFINSVGTTAEGSKLVKEIFSGSKAFTFAKPIGLINYILSLTDDDSIILDFFAGSGTTLHSVFQLNSEEGNRQCILVTNNENGIADEVCYERSKRVIEGYRKPNGELVAGLKNNHLHYYKAAFVPAQRNQVNRRQIVDAATEIICIRESAFTEVSQKYTLAKESLRLFQADSGQFTLVLYYHRYMDEAVGKTIELVNQLSTENGPIKIYAFAPQGERYEEEFETVKDKIVVIPLPEAIYNAYQSSLRRINVKRYQDPGYTETVSGIANDLPEIDFNAPANV